MIQDLRIGMVAMQMYNWNEGNLLDQKGTGVIKVINTYEF